MPPLFVPPPPDPALATDAPPERGCSVANAMHPDEARAAATYGKPRVAHDLDAAGQCTGCGVVFAAPADSPAAPAADPWAL